ncbi:MAG: hypothetical protein JKX70_02455 [Phycisphaerales bacterium]|nr:hypothetical protein [Phycisphaerales bacterium]
MNSIGNNETMPLTKYRFCNRVRSVDKQLFVESNDPAVFMSKFISFLLFLSFLACLVFILYLLDSQGAVPIDVVVLATLYAIVSLGMSIALYDYSRGVISICNDGDVCLVKCAKPKFINVTLKLLSPRLIVTPVRIEVLPKTQKARRDSLDVLECKYGLWLWAKRGAKNKLALIECYKNMDLAEEGVLVWLDILGIEGELETSGSAIQCSYTCYSTKNSARPVDSPSSSQLGGVEVSPSTPPRS